jgi:aryl-alcohol dehydrogenase
MQVTAAVVHEKFGKFVIETVELDQPRDDEILVKVVASGICQTDVHGRDGYFQTPYPAVFGHEGAGIVEAVGRNVRSLAKGDHVVMSFPWCGSCPTCNAGRIAYCEDATKLKQGGMRTDGSTLLKSAGKPVYGSFFQQSSFSSYTIASERFAVKARKDVPLERIAAIACGGQTGAGAVANVLRPEVGSTFAVFGAGAVGLSALMAAKLAGCAKIIAVDIRDERLELARELGATHTVNHAKSKSVVADINAIVRGGVDYSIETSALPNVFREAVESLQQGGGQCVLLGSARSGVDVGFEMRNIQRGRLVRGVVQGEARPKEFLPKLIDLMAEGRMPFERMIRMYDLADINTACADAEAGRTIKPVLRLPH